MSDSIWQTIQHMKTQCHSIRENGVQVHCTNCSSPPQAAAIKFHDNNPLLFVKKGDNGRKTSLWVSLNAALRTQITALPFIPTVNLTSPTTRYTLTHALLSALLSYILPSHISSAILLSMWLSFWQSPLKHIFSKAASARFFFNTTEQEQIIERGQGW